MKYGEFLD